MADNRDIAKIKHLLKKGLIQGGNDKQQVCAEIAKFREEKEPLLQLQTSFVGKPNKKNEIEKILKQIEAIDKKETEYLETLQLEREEVQENGTMVKSIADLTKLVIKMNKRLSKLENKGGK